MPKNRSTSHGGCGCSRHRARGAWTRWVYPVTGLLALIWFLTRVIPKPSRATYPCQRAAMPMASAFVVWLIGLAGSAAISARFRRLVRESRVVLGGIGMVTILVAGVLSFGEIPVWWTQTAQVAEPHGPVGVAKGIHPGRVVWVYDPNATDWDGYDSPEHWWQDEHTDSDIVEKMVSQAIRGVAGRDSDEAAWDAIFTYFNSSRGNGEVGYQPGERIAIKINLTTCNAGGGDVSAVTYDKKLSVTNRIDNSPQMTVALLRQLVYTVGVDQNDITIGDPTGMVPNYWWDRVHPEFPNVRYLDNYGGSGRMRAEFSDTPFHWSTTDDKGKLQDYLPVPFAEASYIINFAILKGHSSGVTLCAKNHYGSLIRTPDGYLRPELPGLPTARVHLNYYNMHLSLPNNNQNPPWSPGTGHYRALVDLMGHSELGGKTVLYLLDGLFGGYYWDAHPYKWNMPPFNGDWPSSLFASLDPVAIDSVGYDFVNAEWPDVVRYGHAPAPKYGMQGGAEDYLHEAALANDPCSGTFYDPDHPREETRLASLGVHEHWNDAIDKQYSRNLGAVEGIELILLHSDPIPGDVDSDGDVDEDDLAPPSADGLAGEDPNDPGVDPNDDPGGFATLR